MAQIKQPTANWFQAEILKSLQEVKDKVDESLQLGRENGEAIRNLRTELGVDGLHGRIPQLEQAMARLDRQQESDHKEVLAIIAENQRKQHEDKNKLLSRIEPMEKVDHKAEGKEQLWEILRNVITSSAAATAIGILAKMLGIIH